MKLVFASWMTAVSIGPSFARAFTRRSSLFGKSSRPLAAMAAMISPPNARREEDRVVWAGTLPDNSDNNSKLARQSETSMEPLLDPPISIPDPYGWMRDEKRSNEEVLNHLKAENTYTESLTSHLAELRETLYKEMLSSIQETDFTTPRPKGDFTYYSRTYEGKSYSVSCRAPKPPQGDDLSEMLSAWDGSADTPVLPGEEIVLDTNAIAEDQSYCSTGTIKMSPSQKVLAYSVDFTGDETYYPVIQSLETKEMILNDTSLEIDAPLVWGNDDQTIFYTKMDEAHRPYQVFRKNLETGVEELLYEEHDELFWMGIEKTLDGKYLFVEMSSMETSEYYFLDLTNPSAELQCIAQRRPKVLYNVDHRDGYWWIASNVGGTPNMKLLVAPAVANCESEWKLVNDADGNILFDGGYERSLDDVESFQTHVVCSGRQGGMPRIWIVSFQQDDVASSVKKMEMLQFEEEAHDVGLNINREYDTETIAVSYDSLITPPSTIDISLQDPSDRKILKEKAVPGYDRSLYGCDRLDVPSRDGTTQIPISIVYRKDIMEEHQKTEKPVTAHLYGYGSYGSCCEADFDATRLPLLGRGVVYVIAHIRGGGEMGRQWYEEPNGGKYLCKKNTFNDFVDVAKWLVHEKKITSPNRLSCEGRSAGGLLIGATLNQAPELFQAAILGVPFVDVVCTMTDASIPLTVHEWEEWGNPNEKKFFEYMLEYSPINQIQKGAKYPSCLLTGGLHDPRVQFWEPAKFAAELRHTQGEGSGLVCLKMDMSAGHFSASDRYKYYKELSFDYAFLLDQLGLATK